MQRKFIPLAALAATLACGVTLADDKSMSGGTIGADYTKMDKDKDGTLSKKEASKNKELTSQWDTLDVNKDGKLDEAEFAQFETSSMGESMDKDSKSGSGSSATDIKY